MFYSTSVQHLQNSEHGVVATFSDGSAQEFDLVVGADGIHSEVRKLILPENKYSYRGTDWAVWGAWRSLDGFDPSSYREMWSDGWMLGLYPVKDKLAVFFGGNKKLLSRFTAVQFASLLRGKVNSAVLKSALTSLEGVENAFFWNLEDCSAKVWHYNRVVLLGDAAAAFLPTAGVGASMAMDSASALADELSRADAEHIPLALELFVKRQYKRVALAQNNSRNLARLMFKNSSVMSRVRDYLIQMSTIESLLKEVQKVMEAR